MIGASFTGVIVTLAVPPLTAMNPRRDDVGRWLRILPRQAGLSWYTLFNQLPLLPERTFDGLVAHLWRRWSPGYDATVDLAAVEPAETADAQASDGSGEYSEGSGEESTEAAEAASQQQLYTALLEQARATVRSGELGQRVRALDAIRRAATSGRRQSRTLWS